MNSVVKLPVFVASADAVKLAEMLAKTEVNQIVQYAKMSEIIGRDVLQNRSLMQTAKAIVQRENRYVFAAVRNVGLKRLQSEDIVDLGDNARARIRRVASTTTKKLKCVQYDAMPKEKQVKHNTTLSMLGVIAELGSEKSYLRLEAKVKDVASTLPAAKASLAALGSIA